MKLLAALALIGCSHTSVLDPDVLSGSIVSVSRTEIVISPDFADSATATIHGIDGVALGWHPGDHVSVHRRDPSVGKTNPFDWDCSVATNCDAHRD